MTQIFFFNDGFPTADCTSLVQRLQVHHKTPRNAFLRLICQEATKVLHEEIRQLPVGVRTSVPPFYSILDLVENYDSISQPLHSILRGVLICIVQLGLFVCYHELSSDAYNSTRGNTCFMGSGYGLLSATAVVASPTLADLPATTAEAIRVALRVGICTHDAAEAIEPRHPGSSSGAWAISLDHIGDETIQEEVDQFNTKLGHPVPSKVYVRETGGGANVLGGPPTKLHQFMELSGRAKYGLHVDLPIYVPYHAPHLYNPSQLAKVTEKPLTSLPAGCLSTVATLLSVKDGKPIHAETVDDLFRYAVSEILTCTVNWAPIIEHAIQSASTTEEGYEPQLFTFGINSTASRLVFAIRAQAPGPRTCDLAEWVSSHIESPRVGLNDTRIAVVGMSCRFPGGSNNPDQFWDVLESGQDVHQRIPADRFDVESHTDPTESRPNTSKTPFGCFIDTPGLFDCGFFDMSPREAEQTDPMHRLALVTAYEALEASGYVPDRTMSTNRNRIGTFYGQSADDYREVNSGQNIDTYFITGGNRAFGPGRINYFFKFSGPSFNCDTACSSSLATVQLACTSLLHGDADMIVAGGLNIMTNPDVFAGLSRAHFLSPTGGCKVFDADADGYCRADGIGSIVLKRLSAAEQDNDPILGVILASATNHSANAVSLTHPHAPTQANLFRQVLQTANVDPLEVDWVEMHGTGTQAGDKEEMESVTSVFAPASPSRTRPLHVTSLKANVGHAGAAAGITALIKALLVFQKGLIPKHIGIKGTLNPNLPDLARLNVYIPTESVPWPSDPSRKRYAMVNNFGASGGNTSILLEEPPRRPYMDPCPCSSSVITVSGKGTAALRNNLASMIDHLEAAEPSLDIPSLSYTTTARRIHHSHRVAVTGSSLQEISRALRQELSKVETRPVTPRSAPRVAFVFSGQGTFYAGISRDLFEQYPPYRHQIQQLDSISVLHGFPSVIPLITNDPALQPHEIDDPLLTQLATVIVEIALYNMWIAVGVTPAVVVGASLGEFAAVYAAGVVSASDVLYLVGQRALLMKELCHPGTHAMLSVRASSAEINRVLRGQACEVACVNGPHDVTVTARVEEIPRIEQLLDEAGLKSTRLNVPFAYHSSQMDPLLDRYGAIARGVHFQTPSVPFLSPLLSRCITESGIIDSPYIRDATRKPVMFTKALDEAQICGLADAKTIWLEVGPHASYQRFIRAAMPEAMTVTSLRRDEDNWRTLAGTMAGLYNAGVPIYWGEWYRPFEPQLRVLSLPRYGWNERNYWIQYNGDWALHKDRLCGQQRAGSEPCPSALRTSLIHHLVKESFSGSRGELIIRADILHSEFFGAIDSHRIGGHPVASTTIHYSIAITMAKYLHTRINPDSPIPGFDVCNFKVHHSLVARVNRSTPQLVEVRALADLDKDSISFSWYNVENSQPVEDQPFATGVVKCGDQQDWLDSWSTSAHLVRSRMKVLNQMADHGTASRLDQGMAYMLHSSLVDATGPYRGLDSLVVCDMEAAAEVTLPPHIAGTWDTAPAPYHLGAFLQPPGIILNGGNAVDNRDFFHIPPSWKSIRLLKPLAAGSRYRSYTVLTPARGERGRYTGDVYIHQEDEIIGVVSGIAYVAYPRVSMSKMFAPPDLQQPAPSVSRAKPATATKNRETVLAPTTDSSASSDQDRDRKTPSSSSGDNRADDNPIIAHAIGIIATETKIELSQLTDATELASIGVDSLLSLVIQQKFSRHLNLYVPTLLFVECETVGDLKASLADYC